jgi:hypothetical protein
MENTANLELFAVHKIFSEYAERIYAYIGEFGFYRILEKNPVFPASKGASLVKFYLDIESQFDGFVA